MILFSNWQLLYVGSLLDYCSLTGFCSPSYSFASLPCWHGSSLRSNWIDNKGKGMLIISSIHTAHILSEFNYREVKWKWNTKLLQESGNVNVLDCSLHCIKWLMMIMIAKIIIHVIIIIIVTIFITEKRYTPERYWLLTLTLNTLQGVSL